MANTGVVRLVRVRSGGLRGSLAHVRAGLLSPGVACLVRLSYGGHWPRSGYGRIGYVSAGCAGAGCVKLRSGALRGPLAHVAACCDKAWSCTLRCGWSAVLFGVVRYGGHWPGVGCGAVGQATLRCATVWCAAVGWGGLWCGGHWPDGRACPVSSSQGEVRSGAGATGPGHGRPGGPWSAGYVTVLFVTGAIGPSSGAVGCARVRCGLPGFSRFGSAMGATGLC